MSSALLSEVGWDEGFAIPVANAENKALEDELQRKQKEKMLIDNKLCECKDRIQAMAEHLNNVRQELTQTQALCKARERETESEMHFKALAEREMGRLRQEMSQLEDELGALREKKNSQENSIFKVSQKLEELKSQLNWDQQTLDAWLEESARKDEDTMAIIKYAQQDESRIRELTLAIEKKTVEANQKRKALDNELTETMSAQIGLDKTAENFRQAHLERQDLIRQWENSIEQMKKRDTEMQQCAMLLTQVNQDIRERNGVIQEKKTFLEREIENNREYEKKITMAERQAAKLRQDFQEQERNRIRLVDELDSLRGMVDRSATEVESMRSQLANVKKEIQVKAKKVKADKLHNLALEEKLRAVTETALTVEERAAQMDQMVKEEEQAIKEVDAELHRERQVLFRKSQELQALRLREKDAVAQLSGSRTVLASLDTRLTRLDQDSLKQQKIIYNQDFQIKLLERKMSRLKGDVNTDEKQALEHKTSQLAETLEEKRRTAGLLTTQLKKLQDDIRCVKKETEKTGSENRNMTTKIEELNLFNDTTDKELKKLRLKKQDTMVEDNIMKLEIKRLRDLLYNKADGVLSLEKRRLQLRTAMKEREEEIRVHREMLCKQVKITDQERQGLSAEVHERLSKVDKMRTRYEIMTITMATPEGEEEKSQAYYVIKAAQEKEELQREGDDLDANIRKMEKEIRALENTLHVVNNHNSTFRKSFNKVTESSEEYHEKLRLEEQKRAVEEKYKFKRRQIRELQEDVQSMKDTLDRLLEEEGEEDNRTEDTQSRIVSINRELVSQQEKLDRVTKTCSKLTKEIRSARKSKEETFEEKDIALRELKDFNRSINKMLLEIMEEHPDIRSALQLYFVQVHLPLPSPASTPVSRHSSKTSSARSSASLRSAGSSTSSSPRASGMRSPPTKTLELGLGLSVTSPPLITSPRPLSSASSSTSSSSSRKHRKSP
ncbi:coiled-coil domain-containing protein 39 [Osmerus eperlanus]|uniref:coiled-coil domain-containing protein 39 n=1 Tax=Osmerus eperlanus TaxID=29151 RepID=UPI002E13AEE7